MWILVGLFLLNFTQECQAANLRPNPEGPSPEDRTYSSESYSAYEGKAIGKIRVLGLTRSSETAVRALLGGKEGELFSTERWIYGLKKLYNTGSLYDLRTEIHDANEGRSEIEIDLTLKDKWTLLPNLAGAGGGGSSSFQVGVWDLNIGGYFTNLLATILTYNNLVGFDFNLFQEWILDTEFIAGLDFAHLVNTASPENQAGQVTQNFAWTRTRVQALFGRRYGTQVRLFSYFELFQDNMVQTDATTQAQVYSGLQYRIRPTLIVGRSNLTNYLEEGFELNISPGFANFFSPSTAYFRGVVSYKYTSIIGENSNFALFLKTGIMNLTPLPYQFRLGGLDSIRGYDTNRMNGNLYAYGNFEYRPLLWSHRFDWSLFDRVAIQGCLFSDLGWIQGSSALSGLDPTSLQAVGLVSAGVGFRLIFVKYAGSIIRFDLAQTLSPAQGWGFSFGIGQFF